MVLTGWQRYDHFAPLCELLPVGLPSLAICLQTVISGFFDANVHQQVSEMLKCEGPLELHLDFSNSEYSKCHFPGSEIYEKVHQLYALRHHFSDVAIADKVYMDETAKSLNSTLPGLLAEIYGEDVVEEWMLDNVYGPSKEAYELYFRTKPLTHVDSWQPRPYPSD